MTFEPKEWQCGEVITADDLNRIEQGVAEANSGSINSTEPINQP